MMVKKYIPIAVFLSSTVVLIARVMDSTPWGPLNKLNEEYTFRGPVLECPFTCNMCFLPKSFVVATNSIHVTPIIHCFDLEGMGQLLMEDELKTTRMEDPTLSILENNMTSL